ncbi:coproporphyrinogen III oxidase [Clostridium tarantellae]|uniref:Coproporphyrinogen III oxidase n=1 Tax=Clostridium tarantellae TaxID=39493 RepID=A0A6I1MJU9_9CLOT|nr:coproporphyrinogen III oxidase [Clostridium tarantellae]MPQ42983.1 coproporphyrinogen III oxidase [Clostridium tarantellae]
MYIKIKLNDLKYRYDVYQMFNIFHTFCEIKFNEYTEYDYLINIDNNTMSIETKNIKEVYLINEDGNFKEQLKKGMFKFLSNELKDEYPWGTLVGIRPSKIALSLLEEGYSEEEVIKYFEKTYLAKEEKARLCIDVAKVESKFVNKDEKSISIYVGMPFCPTRCLYCSFAANPIASCKKDVNNYLEALKKEINNIKDYIHNNKLTIETVYFGGGTPTSINNEQFEDLMKHIYESFIYEKNIKEFTVECGRPDSITEEKLKSMKKYKVSRISINPQTMNDKSLKAIGRGHLTNDVIEKFKLARSLDFDNINMDMIIGLPNEDLEEVKTTCKLIKKLNPDSLTVHGLSIKRASRLYENLVLKKIIKIANQQHLNIMYKKSKELSEDLNMYPYYMYRQKNMVGNMENVGYARKDKECIYNIQMIEDKQTIIALGADAVSKVVYLNEGKNRIERFGNVKDVKEYVKRIDEMIEGKIKLLDTLYSKK